MFSHASPSPSETSQVPTFRVTGETGFETYVVGMSLYKLIAAHTPVAMRALVPHGHPAPTETKFPGHDLATLDTRAILSLHEKESACDSSLLCGIG